MPDERPPTPRFESCRWAATTFCDHPEVRAYCGRAGFDPTSWCSDCVHYKRKRVVRPRAPLADRSLPAMAGMTLDRRGNGDILGCLPYKAREPYRLRLLEMTGEKPDATTATEPPT